MPSAAMNDSRDSTCVTPARSTWNRFKDQLPVEMERTNACVIESLLISNAVTLGVDLVQASRMLSEIPARYMGLNDRGELEAGKRADILVLDEDFQIQEVYVAGRQVC